MDMQLFHYSHGVECGNNGKQHAFDTCTHALNNFISLNRNLMKIKMSLDCKSISSLSSFSRMRSGNKHSYPNCRIATLASISIDGVCRISLLGGGLRACTSPLGMWASTDVFRIQNNVQLISPSTLIKYVMLNNVR